MSKYTAFRCPEDLLDKAKGKARQERRSLSNYIITLIEKDVGMRRAVAPKAASKGKAAKPAAKKAKSAAKKKR